MKPLALHLPSVAIGGAFALTLAVALGAAQVSTQLPPSAPATPRVVPGTAPPLERPFARDLVVIKAGTPFVVPTGRWLVLVGLGRAIASSSTLSCTVRVDGVSYLDFYLSGTDLMQSLGSGLPFMSAQSVELVDAFGSGGFAVGYLEDV